MKHLLATIVAIPLLASSVAMAGEPVKLSNAQMDKVTAGAISAAVILLAAQATGANALADTRFQAQIIQIPAGPMNLLRQGTVQVIAQSASAN
jgi:hypothetical protein